MQEKMRYILRLLIVIMLNVFVVALIGHTYRSAANREPAQVFSRIGSRGDEVRAIQERLRVLDLYDGEIDGVFGSGTANAVKAFQRQSGLTVDGIADQLTLSALGLAPSQPAGGAVSDSDYRLLARFVAAEASDLPYNGQVAVAALLLNRMEHPSFPDTLAGVAYQPGAFASVERGLPRAIGESAYRAAKEALNGVDPSGGAIYYYNATQPVADWLLNRPLILTIGDCAFCS